MVEFLSKKSILALLLTQILACQSTTPPEPGEQPSHSQSLRQKEIFEQFEATEFSKCIDSDGRNTGSLNFIWRVKNTQGQSISPFIVGFSGTLRSLQGNLFHFQTLTSVEDSNFGLPPVNNPQKFPIGSYAAYSLLFPYDEQDAGWAFVKLNSQKITPSDVTGAQLLLPKFVIGGEYSTRYYLRLEGKQFHEFSCQAMSDKVRARLSTFMRKDGSAAFESSRGSRTDLVVFAPAPAPTAAPAVAANSTPTAKLAASAAPMLVPTATPIPAVPAEPVRDFRPVARPSDYDSQFKHVRIYECGKNGAIDAIWRLKNARGDNLEQGKAFITGFAGELKDNRTGNAFYFSSIQLEPAPAFYSGQMPAQGTYYFPSIEFRDEQIKKSISVHSRVPGLNPGKFAAAATVYLPRNSTGNTVSVSLSLGSSLRGTPYQATAECLPVNSRVSHWLKNCMAAEAPAIPNLNCNI
jgi:hypothetical protein